MLGGHVTTSILRCYVRDIQIIRDFQCATLIIIAASNKLCITGKIILANRCARAGMLGS